MKRNNMDQLKVGDRVYIERMVSLESIQTIERITKTMAFSKNYKFRLDIGNNGSVSVIGSGSTMYSRLIGRIETPELADRWRVQKIKSWYHRNKDGFNFEQIEAIYKLLCK